MCAAGFAPAPSCRTCHRRLPEGLLETTAYLLEGAVPGVLGLVQLQDLRRNKQKHGTQQPGTWGGSEVAWGTGLYILQGAPFARTVVISGWVSTTCFAAVSKKQPQMLRVQTWTGTTGTPTDIAARRPPPEWLE